MTLDTANALVDAGYLVVCYVLPVVIFLALRRSYPAPIPATGCAAGTIVVCWILLFAFRELTRGITVDYINAHPPVTHHPEEDGPYYYDGVGGNVLVMFLGWLPATLTLCVLFVLRRLWRWLRPKRATPLETEN